MAKPGFSLKGNLKEISRGSTALRNLLNPVVNFGFSDLSIFEKNLRYDSNQRLDFIPNNHKFLIAINSPNVGPNVNIIKLRKISNVSPDELAGTRNLSIETGDFALCSPNSDTKVVPFIGNQIISVTKPASGIADIGTIELSNSIRNGEGASDGSEFYSTSNKPSGYQGGGVIQAFAAGRSGNEKIAIIKQNGATYSPASGRFTFGTDIQFTFTEGDIISKVNVKGNDTPFEVASGSSYFNKRISPNREGHFGRSFYPLIVSNYNVNDKGQTSFILKRQATNSPVLFNMLPSAHQHIFGHNFINGKVLKVGELSNGTFSDSAQNDLTISGITQSSSNPLTTTGSGTGLQISIKTQALRIIKVTIVDGGTGHKVGDVITCPKENVTSGTLDLTFKILSATNERSAESPQLMIFNSPSIIQFTRQVPVSQSDFRGLVPPIFRAQGGPGALIELGDSQVGGSGSVKSIYTHFEPLGEMYNIAGTSDRVTNTVSSWSSRLIDHTFSEVLNKISNDVNFSEEVGRSRIVTNQDNTNTTRDELIIDGALQIQDPGKANEVDDVADNIFVNSPRAPAVYIKEESLTNPGQFTFTRAFSTFDGPWTADTSAGNKHIRTSTTTDQDAADFVSTINIGKLEFIDRIVLKDYASKNIVTVPGVLDRGGSGPGQFQAPKISGPAGAMDSSLNSPRSTGFTHKMPIVVKEKDESTGEVNDVVYFLLLQGPLS